MWAFMHMLKYPLSYIRVTQLDAMKIVIITYMISYSLNGHAQLSRRAESVFLLYVLCVRGGFVESMQMCRLFRPFAYHLKAMKQRKFRAHLLRVQRCPHFAYSSTNSLQSILWSHNIGIVTRKPDFVVCPQQRHRPVCASM